MNKKKVIPAVALLLVAAAAGGWWYFGNSEEQDENRLVLYGNVDIRETDLAFNNSEHIDRMLVQEGDRVHKGQQVAALHRERLEAEVAVAEARVAAQRAAVARLEVGSRPEEVRQARANVAAARARLSDAQVTFDRNRDLSGKKLVSRQALDNARAQFDVDDAQLKVKEKALNLALEGPRKEDIAAAKNTLEALKASLSLLQIRLADMTLISPAQGIIQNRILEPGEMASPTRPVVTLALTDPKWARVYVPEPDLGRINLGMKAKILSDSFPDQSFEGWIGFISPVAEFTPKTVETEDLRTKLVYEVRAFVHDSKDLLRLGMPVTVIVDLTAPASVSRDGKVLPKKTAKPDKG